MTDTLKSMLNEEVREDMEWKDAVTSVETVIRNWMDFMSDYPDHYSQDDIDHVEKSWFRILRG